MSHRFLFFMSLILAVLRNEVHVRLFSFCGYRKELANPLNSLIQQIIFTDYTVRVSSNYGQLSI